MRRLCQSPNLEHADRLVDDAVARRRAQKADPDAALRLHELVSDDGGSYSPFTDARHFGQVARLLMRLVYELDVYGSPGPWDLPAKHHWVVDVHVPVTDATRTQYLAVSVDQRRPVLLPLPDLPATLLDGTGSVADTRQAVRDYAAAISDLVNLGLPAARTLAAAEGDQP